MNDKISTKLIYGGNQYYIRQLSCVSDICLYKFSVNSFEFRYKMFFVLNFSGSELRVERYGSIPRKKWNGKYKKIFGIFKVKQYEKVPEYDKAINHHKLFTFDNYCKKFGVKLKDFNHEFMKWMAQELNIMDDYNYLIEQYDYCMEAISKYFNYMEKLES